jgi:hypothetical protein
MRFNLPPLFLSCLLFLLTILTSQGQTTAGQTVPGQHTPEPTVPRLVRFTGMARDLSGKPISGVVGITFALYAVQMGGVALWMETQNVQGDSSGHYFVLLGSTKPDGLPAELFASEKARWIGVQIEQQTEQPRTLLVSAPYALKAGDAETLGGLPPSAFVQVAPNATSAAESSPSRSATGPVSPVTAGSAAKSSNVTTTGGTANTIPIFTTATNIQNSILTQSGTTVKAKGSLSATSNITSSATVSGKLISSTTNVDVAGDLREDINGKNKGGSGGYSPGIRFGIGSTGEAIASDRAGTVNQNGLDLYTDFVSRMSVTKGGHVGIGTQTPGGWLEVDSQAFVNALNANGWNAPSGSNTSGGFGLVATGGNSDPIGNSGTGGTAVVGTGGGGVGVPSFDGVGGLFTGGNTSFDGDGVEGNAGSGYAGNFSGDLNVTGAIFAGTKDFKIDHPLDPANKYLFHASVESSEMKNIYDGVVVTDAQGEAIVPLPSWFEALNHDFRYQLTVIGQFAQAIVVREIQNHEFAIRTSLPNVKVSWQVTGVRQDAYAKAHPLVVEQEKDARLRGFYIHPELHGAPQERQIEWARHPELMKTIQRQRQEAREKQARLTATKR